MKLKKLLIGITILTLATASLAGCAKKIMEKTFRNKFNLCKITIKCSFYNSETG